MSSGGGGEKTEKPTPRRLKQAKKDGQIPRTPEIGGWLSMLIVSMAMGPLVSHEFGAVRDLMTRSLRVSAQPRPEVAFAVLRDAATHVFITLVVLGSIVMVIGVLSALAQGGFYLSPKLAKPNPKKLNPLQGAKRMFGPQAAWEGAKMLLKTSVVGGLAYSSVHAMMPLIGGMVPIDVVLTALSDKVGSLLLSVGIAGLVMAGADYGVVRRRIGKQVRMSREELKQEHKQTEGDPMVKSAMRSRQLQIARNRMLKDVAEADVVLVNPTHVAVALSYRPERGAPRVVARGAGAIADKIRQTATENRVPMVRDVPLARALYRSCEVGQEIPSELWAAVAQVLAFVIRLRSRGQQAGAHSTPRTQDAVPAVPRGTRRRTPSAISAAKASGPPDPSR
ncbi:EscU/YscU/HrcU family type III secretion system export apparatus switch protein [Nocardioides humilatus]|uniref:EscU/YscU/HrcU family type III secretion system export apparatus switch protein n=1 Tax=Nocardioides humilatus TaxID=2607660 RepID=A0A5B1LD65_9ACTN|nr:EscU/YscU/HrcU family type III secretion system export apparatus switch protein [Nocardioides humilatus]KAA1417689.1 EscU/YscU/HrcU family type III secretion system export apparatus switch protein [Nocardioides humilatus]